MKFYVVCNSLSFILYIYIYGLHCYHYIFRNQLPTDEKIKFSDIIINNDDDLLNLEMKCDVVYNKYLKSFFF